MNKLVYRSKNIPYGLGGVALSIGLFYLSSYLATVWIDLTLFVCGFILLDILFGLWSLAGFISGVINEGSVNECLRSRFETIKKVEIDSKSPVLWGDSEGLFVGGKYYTPSGPRSIYLGNVYTLTNYYSPDDHSHVTLVKEKVFHIVFLTCFGK